VILWERGINGGARDLEAIGLDANKTTVILNNQRGTARDWENVYVAACNCESFFARDIIPGRFGLHDNYSLSVGGYHPWSGAWLQFNTNAIYTPPAFIR
jgi:hypothetical protein